MTWKTNPSYRKRPAGRIRARRVLALIAGFSLLAGLTFAATPPAGSVIGNQATATYLDGSGTSRTVTSNLVETIVQQVAVADIEAAQSKTAAAGTTAYFPHTVKNGGNGSDSFTLSIASVTDTNNILTATPIFYADANHDGIPDNLTPITATPSLAAGEVYGIVVGATVASGATASQTATINVKAQSVFDTAKSDTNADTLTVSNNAVINITKSINVGAGTSPNGNPGNPNTQITVTLTYANAGLATATALNLRDIMPAGMAYKSGSGKWNGVAVTDAVGDDPAGFSYAYATGTVTATIASIAAGTTGILTFEVTIDSGLASQVIQNRADFDYNDSSAPVGSSYALHTNSATYTVTGTSGVILSDTIDGNSSTTDDTIADDIVHILTAVAGKPVIFDNVIKNTGATTDTFNITSANLNFPAGTSIILFRANATSKLTDSNSDGIVDTGPMQPGEIKHIVTMAILPPAITVAGPYTITTIATSVNSPTTSDNVTDTLGTSTSAAAVDLINTAAQADSSSYIGTGVYVSGAPVVATVNAKASGSVDIILGVQNTGTVTDSYTLSYLWENSFTPPAGWRIAFIDQVSGQEVTTTGSIASTAVKYFMARVTLPNGANADLGALTQVLRFKVQSPTTLVEDQIRDAIRAVKDLAITPDNSGQTASDEYKVYTHFLLNLGTTVETAAPITTSNSLSGSNWTSKVYWDSNNNGVLDLGTDPEITNLSSITGGLVPGQKIQLFVRVHTPNPVTSDTTNVTTVAVALTGDTVATNNTAQDTTTVGNTNFLTLEKLQALDANCDGTPDGSFKTTQIQAKPGQCLQYKVTATNPTAVAVTSVVIEDTTPPYTTYFTCSGSCAAATTGGNLAVTGSNSSAAQFKVNVSTLAPSGTCVLTFNLKIDGP